MSKLKPLVASFIFVAAFAASASAQAKLTATVYTASPGGFLVNSTLVAGAQQEPFRIPGKRVTAVTEQR